MSVEAMAAVLHHAQIGGTAKLVLLGIANHEGDGGAFPAIATLARYANVDHRTVQRSIAKLSKAALIEVDYQRGGTDSTRNDRRPNRYRVLVRCPEGCDGTTQHRVTPTPPRNGNGVTPVSQRGDIRVANGVTPTPPEPSLEPSSNHPAREDKPRSASKRSPVPTDWTPGQRERAKADSVGMTAATRRFEWQQFIDHHTAAGSLKADWPATWRTWCGNWVKYGAKQVSTGDDHDARVLAGYA